MARPGGEINVVCQNPRCRYYLKEGGKDIIKSGNCTGHQRYYCKHRKAYFMKTKGTQLYRKRLSEDEISAYARVEKNGIRSIERLTGHHRDTIGGLLEDLAEHAERVNDYLIRNLDLTPFECDGFCSVVKKTEKG